jgi:hypothetical protein
MTSEFLVAVNMSAASSKLSMSAFQCGIGASALRRLPLTMPVAIVQAP